MEVLSESTRRIDEHEKREASVSIDSLVVYLMVESSVAAVVAYRRTDGGFRREGYAGLDAIVPLPEVECELASSELYENVEFLPPPADVELDGRP